MNYSFLKMNNLISAISEFVSENFAQDTVIFLCNFRYIFVLNFSVKCREIPKTFHQHLGDEHARRVIVWFTSRTAWILSKAAWRGQEDEDRRGALELALDLPVRPHPCISSLFGCRQRSRGEPTKKAVEEVSVGHNGGSV